MKIMIISDTHGKHENFIELMEQTDRPDMVIHCGDVEGENMLSVNVRAAR